MFWDCDTPCAIYSLNPYILSLSEQQGVAWNSPLEGDSLSLSLIDDSEPLYAVPHKEHHKFTLDEFTLHKMLGKGSFGKVGITHFITHLKT